ncbi:MAG: M16 family metallopeptidase, partial [Planctomycetota bacterium]
MRKLALVAALVVPTAHALAGEPAEPKPVQKKLANGLRVVAKQAPGTGLVALACFVDGGNRTEAAELSGLSHYYEHLVFRGGTAKQAELETRKVFTQLGTFYGYTSEDATCFYFVVPLSNLDEALWRHFDAVMKVQVTQEKVDKERDVVLNEYRMRVADSPGGELWHELYRAAFTKHPYGRTTIGLREVIEGSKLDRFRSFYEERYVANQIVISVAGDLPADELVKKVEATWASAPRGKESFELGAAEPEQKELRAVVKEREGTQQSYLALAFRSCAAMDEDRVVHDVLSFVLAGGESSRLQRGLVARRVALSAGAWSPSCKDAGLFTVSLTAEPGKEGRALEETVALLRGVARTGPTEEELDNARRRLATETIFGGESLKDEALRLGTWAILGDPDAGTTYVEKVKKVTAAQLQKAAAKLFRSASATLSVVNPKGSAPRDWASLVKGLDSDEARASLVEHPSGARLVIEEARRSKVVALDLKIAGGQLAETPSEAGVAHLAEILLARGTRRLDRAALARELDRLAVRIGTSSGVESTTLSIRATDETFEQAIALLGEMLHEPAFAEDEVRRAREETLEAIAAVEDDSFSLTQQKFAEALYGAEHPYGRPVLGTKATVAALGVEHVRRFHEKVYRPESMVVAVVGAIERARAEQLVEKHLLRPSAPAAPRRYAVPPTAPARAQTILHDRKREQATLDLGAPVVSVNEPDYLPLQVALRHLGNALFFKYVYEEGVAYRMWTYLRPGTGTRPVVLETGIAVKNFARVRDGLVAAVSSLAANGL